MPHRNRLPRLRVDSLLLMFAFGLICAAQAWAQYPAIGELYAEPQILIPVESSDHPGLMNQAEVIDLNGDGRDDAVYSGSNPDDPEGETQAYMLVADGSGSMELRTDALILGGIPVTDRGFRQIVPGDFNGDGRIDLFLESHGGEPDCGDGTVNCFTGGPNSLLLANDEGQWVNVTSTNLPAQSDFTHGTSVADFDKDGDVDIWVNNLGGSPFYNPDFSYLLHNDGEGKFSVVADNSNPWETPITGRNGIFPEGEYLGGFWSFAVDAEGDGDMDLGLGWWEQQGVNVVLLNDGAGNFSLPEGSAFPSPRDYVGALIQHALVHDLNADGLEDLLLHQSRTDFSGPTLQVLISNGDGTFRDETDSRYPSAPVDVLSDFQLHDLDNDGYMDLFSHVDFARADIRINDGEGSFRPLAQDWLTGLGWNWIVLDVDGDGGTDFLSDEWYGITLNKMNQPYGPHLDGTAAADRLIGGAHDNVFRGHGGDDVLDGGLGNDQLDGGPGSDILKGGKGDDWYIFNPGDLTDNDVIGDSQGTDRIVFNGFGLEKISLARQTGNGDLVLELADGGSIIVEGHFLADGSGVEELKVGSGVFGISGNPGFVSGSIEELIAGGQNDFVINPGLNDAWYNPATSGQGFFITVFPDLGAVSLAWFTYDTDLPAAGTQANLGDPGHRWVTAVGPFAGYQATMDIELTSGGLFDTPTEIQRTDPPGSDGTIILRFNSCNAGTVEYDIPSINRKGIVPIQRVASDNIALCESLKPD